MLDVLSGFGIILIVIGAGYATSRTKIFSPALNTSLNQLLFWIFTPALLFSIMASYHVTELIGIPLLIAGIAAIASIVLYMVISVIFFRRPLQVTLLGGASAGFVNSNNIGLPVAIYVLGNAAAVAPIILMQVTVLWPIVLAILDIATSGGRNWRNWLRPFVNPIILGSILGVIVGMTEAPVPSFLMDAIGILGQASVPLVLFAFGLSLRGEKPMQMKEARVDVISATVIKILAMPVIAWAVAYFGFGITGHELYTIVAVATLPTAQNTYNFAARYGFSESMVRDVILITTILAVPVMLVVALLLAA